MSAVASKAAFPRIVWEAPAMRDLDARARAEIEAAGRVVRVEAGDLVFTKGDPADDLCVVVEGEIEILDVARGEVEARSVRRAEKGELFGEDAAAWEFGARRHSAKARVASRVAMVPVSVVKRALDRVGASRARERLERTLRRAAALDVLRATPLAKDRDLEALVDVVEHVRLGRSEFLYRAGDPAAELFVVADGMIRLQSEGRGAAKAEGYATRLDLVGDDPLGLGATRRLTAVASGPTWLLQIPRSALGASAERLHEAFPRIRSSALALPVFGANTTAHVFEDVYRIDVARSLLVIDQDQCVRCGHCTWSCAAEHDDGVARLVRRGDKIVVGDGKTRVPLLLPNSCQHCKDPACMVDCPTGAIGRDARGEVFIREELCTGCGSCAKGCPWENIQMAPRAPTREVPYAEVAVKCDLCTGRAGGPACVSACPVSAIARVDPSAELRAAPSREGERLVPPPSPAWGLAVGAGLLGAASVRMGLGAWATGVALGVLFVTLFGYAVGKRFAGRVPARPLYVAHLVLGALVPGLVVAHGALRPSASAAFALTLVAVFAVVTGGAAAFFYATLPPRIARLETRGLLPEDFAQALANLEDRLFRALTGRTELVKALFARVLRPALRSRVGLFVLAASGRSAATERRRLRARVDALREGRGGDKLDGLDDLVALVVEARALRVARALRIVMRGLVVVHVGATGATAALTVAHVLWAVGATK